MTVDVVKLGFVGLNVTHRDRMVRHFEQVVGLPVSAEAGPDVYFACGSEHHALSLHASSGPSGIRHVGFRIGADASLDEAARDLAASGVACERLSDAMPGVRDALRITDPDGYTVFLFRESDAAPAYYSGRGVGPTKIGHVAVFVENAPRAATFYTDVLGFRWSDWCQDLFVFMRCNADHHSLNLTSNRRRGMFHVAFELKDFSAIGRACDLLSAHGVPLAWGPGRHGMGHNIFAYHRDPDGNIVEFMAELDRISDERIGFFDPRPYHTDFPQKPKVWPFGPESSNVWGIMPPAGFMD